MSGDVQPRKRKDKKRRKDEGGEQIPIQTHTPISTSLSNDDVNIHVHKEGGTGGGICAKLVFFVLLSALVVVLGMIITQYRGLTDVDTVDTKSRFAQVFEGWIDSSSHHRVERDIKESKESHEADGEGDDDVENVSEAEDEEEHDVSEEEEDTDEKDDNEISEENEEDEEQQDEDEEETPEHSEEDQFREDSDENLLADEDDYEDSEAEASDEEKGRYEDVESEEKDEEVDENEKDNDDNEQGFQSIDSDEKEDTIYKETSDEDEVSKEGQDDRADEPTEDSDDKVESTIRKAEARKGIDEKDISPDEEQQGSSGSTTEPQHSEDSDSDRQSDDATGYEYSTITNKEDHKIKTEIDEAQKTVQSE